MPKDYYLVLGITSDATPYDIKDAYRKRVKEFHPDHYGGKHSEFLAIQEAYSVLSDPIKRQTHDLEVLSQKRKLGSRYGERMRPGPRRHVEPLIPDNKMPIDLGAAGLARSFHTYGSSFDELFDIIFSNFRETARSKSEGLKNRNVVITGHFRISDII